MRRPHVLWLAVALVGTAHAGGFDPGRPGGPDNAASVVGRTTLEEGSAASRVAPRAHLDDLATELAWLEGEVWMPHTNIWTRRCDRRRLERDMRRLERQVDRLTRMLERGPPALELAPVTPLAPPRETSWLGAADP